MKKLLPFLMILTCFSAPSCSDECAGALADLTTDLATNVIGSVFTGNPFNIFASIKNLVPVVSTCVGNDAGPSMSNYRVNYGTSESNYTDKEIDEDYQIVGITAGSTEMENFETTFNQPGFYELITVTDVNNDVKEDEEDNNTYSAEAPFNYSTSVKGNPRSRLIFEVLPNPDFTPDPDAPRVIFKRL